MKIDKKDVILIVLVVLFVVNLSFTALDKYNQAQKQLKDDAYKQGVNDGARAAIGQVIQQVSTCQQVTLMYNNQTINVVAVPCLRGNSTEGR